MQLRSHPSRTRDSLIALLVCTLFGTIIAITHSTSSVVSFDEGFHGGAAFFVSTVLSLITHGQSPHNARYIVAAFRNGLGYYPPLWTLVAGSMGWILGPSLVVYRAATTVFYVGLGWICFLFLRREGQPRPAAFVATLSVLTMPMLVIYSNLMMREVPLAFGVAAMVLATYCYLEGIWPHTWRSFIALAVIWGIAAHSKLPALPVAVACLGLYLITSTVFFWREKQYRRLFKPEILLLPLISVITLAIYIHFSIVHFDQNMVAFFVGQSNDQTSAHHSFIVNILSSLLGSIGFYLRDFKHMPVQSVLWIGSLLGYALVKRNRLSVLLLSWVAGVYLTFSAVHPQVPQYIAPLYAPLGIAFGLCWHEIITFYNRKRAKHSPFLAILLCLGVILFNLSSLRLSEAYGWRTTQTNQVAAATYIADHAQDGDRVVTWYDGERFLVALYGKDKHIQVIDGASPICQQALTLSYNWAVMVSEPPAPSSYYTPLLVSPTWEAQPFGYGTTTYHNSGATLPLAWEVEESRPSESIADSSASGGKAVVMTNHSDQPSFWGCYQVVPPGTYVVHARVKLIQSAPISEATPVLALDVHSISHAEEDVSINTPISLLGDNEWHDVSVEYARLSPNTQTEITLYAPEGSEILLDSLLIEKK